MPIVFTVTFLIGRRSQKLAVLWLSSASLAFYAIWDIRFVLLLVLSISFNYSAGYFIATSRLLSNNKREKKILILSILVNLVVLGYFKYVNFFVITTNQIYGYNIPLKDIILPLGISFYTFTQIAFLVDVYRGFVKEYKFNNYLLFVTYFPHLIAGPVLHHKQMMPQFDSPNTFRINTENIAVGITIFIIGLSKKVLIADSLANYATPIFDASSLGYNLGLVEAWVGALAYTFQLYFDFSGYSDMAIGLSLIFNVRLPMNFNSPYKSSNIIEFWRRWHMTLSAFLRDYLYIPLGGNRHGQLHRYFNLMITMLLGGLWHGAGWTFVIWGGLHGLYLMINHGWREIRLCLNWGVGGRVGKFIATAITFLAVVIAWVFFRADTYTSAISMLSSMAGFNGASLPEKYNYTKEIFPFTYINFDGFISAINLEHAIRILSLSFIIVWLFPNVSQIFAYYKPTWNHLANNKTQDSTSQGKIELIMSWKFTKKRAFVMGILFSFVMLYMSSNKTSEFLYFQF